MRLCSILWRKFFRPLACSNSHRRTTSPRSSKLPKKKHDCASSSSQHTTPHTSRHDAPVLYGGLAWAQGLTAPAGACPHLPHLRLNSTPGRIPSRRSGLCGSAQPYLRDTRDSPSCSKGRESTEVKPWHRLSW